MLLSLALLATAAAQDMVRIEGGWATFGTSFSDEDIPKEFAPKDDRGRAARVPEGVVLKKKSSVPSPRRRVSIKDRRPCPRWCKCSGSAARDDIDATSTSWAINSKNLLEIQNTRPRPRSSGGPSCLSSSNATINERRAAAGPGRPAHRLHGVYVPPGETLTIDREVEHTRHGASSSSSRCRGTTPSRSARVGGQAAMDYATELEWETAARSGLEDEPFPWGDRDDDVHTRMNGWEGAFPDENLAKDGFIGVAPVDEYAPNAFGVYNAVGNV